jgi:hypothetical protein
MNTITYGDKSTARLVGILYIIGAAAGASSLSFLGVAENPNAMITGAILILVVGFALAMIPAFMFPILRRHSEAPALGYVIFRGALIFYTGLCNRAAQVPARTPMAFGLRHRGQYRRRPRRCTFTDGKRACDYRSRRTAS